jgi:uncharacterized protein YbaR (Trm112 family)
MATFYKHLREESDYSWLSTDSPEPQRNRAATGPECNHPILAEPEAKRQGMYGYYGDLYCPNCQEMFDFIFVEFEKRYPEFLSAWKEIIMREMDEDVMLCPRCGQRNLELV